MPSANYAIIKSTLAALAPLKAFVPSILSCNDTDLDIPYQILERPNGNPLNYAYTFFNFTAADGIPGNGLLAGIAPESGFDYLQGACNFFNWMGFEPFESNHSFPFNASFEYRNATCPLSGFLERHANSNAGAAVFINGLANNITVGDQNLTINETLRLAFEGPCAAYTTLPEIDWSMILWTVAAIAIVTALFVCCSMSEKKSKSALREAGTYRTPDLTSTEVGLGGPINSGGANEAYRVNRR